MTQTVAALATDVADLAATLLLLSDAAAQRGDGDLRRALRGLARQAEAVGERLEQLEEEAT